MSNEKVATLDEGLEVWKLDAANIKEQDVNAQVMDKRRMKILTSNIKNRGALESLPYVYKDGDKFQVVSGHHRIRAAVAAGMTQVYALVETRHMTKSQITSKQIAHNELVGEADSEILAQLVKQMDEADDIIASGLTEEWMNSINGQPVTIDVPNLDFGWRKVEMAFLPKQFEEFETLAKSVDSKTEMVGLVDRSMYSKFCDAMVKYGRTQNIKSFGAIVSKLTEVALKEIQEAQNEQG